MMKKLKKIPTNLVINDIVTYNACECSKSIPKGNEKYYDLVEVTQPDGSRKEQLIERDYPITAEYVKSFEQSADYKLDLDGAIANGHSKANLGDVSSLQSLYSMDTAEIEALGQKLIKASALIKAQKETKKSEVKTDGNESTQQ